jgi:hypothetical protein
MGLRFQRRMTLFPGVALNFSKSGVSVTLGRPGACVNIGGEGATATVGLPGSGLSYRHKLGGSPQHTEPAFHREDLEGEAIKSAPTESLTSKGLESLKTLILEVEARRVGLNASLNSTHDRLDTAERGLARARHWLWGMFRRSRIPELEGEVQKWNNEISEIQDLQAGAYIDLSIDMPPETAKLFQKATERFKALAKCEMIWDLTHAATTDKAERSAASTSYKRERVRFTTHTPGPESLFSMDGEILELGNANGPALQVFPGFILIREEGSLSVVCLSELDLGFEESRFIEDEPVPSDATVIDHAWYKSNKDGSPDRRFKGNYQIPVVNYGELSLATKEGLNEVYMFSNPRLAYEFGTALEDVGRSMSPNP